MPRPSTTDSLDSSHDLQQRLNPPTSSAPSTPNINVPLIINNSNPIDDLANSNSSTSTRLIQQHSLPTIISDKKTSNIHILSIPKQHNDSTTSTNDINKSSSIQRKNSIMTTSSNSRPLMQDKSIQCIDDNGNSTGDDEQITKSN
jgi:hypothetical protein